jgi:hypothetical protein
MNGGTSIPTVTRKAYEPRDTDGRGAEHAVRHSFPGGLHGLSRQRLNRAEFASERLPCFLSSLRISFTAAAWSRCSLHEQV